MKEKKGPLTRSEIMSRVRAKDTRPEMRVRSFLHAAGLRYRLHPRTLPGRPDLVFTSRRCVLFIHGCFWHRHPGCPSTRTPKTRVEFWEQKFKENVKRDEAAIETLEREGWIVLVMWECETRNQAALECLLNKIRTIEGRRRGAE